MELIIIPLVVIAVVLVFVFQSLQFVPQGFSFTVERFGRYTRTLNPGLNILTPVLDRVGRRMNMMETVLDVPRQDVITRDNANVSCDAIVFIQVIDPVKAAYEVNNLTGSITALAMTNIRSVVGSMDLDEVLSNRDGINSRLLGTIDAATQPWGVKLTRIEIKDLTPPAEITEAMTRQMKAERFRRAEVLQAEGEKQSAILRAEGLKQATILEAEGRREAAFRDAEAREREGEAEAKATAYVSEAIARGDVNAINYFLGQKYVAAFEKLASTGNKTVIIPAEFSAILGTIEGIRTLTDTAKAQAEGAVPPAGRRRPE